MKLSKEQVQIRKSYRKKLEEMKAKAVKYNESEAQEVIRGKTRDFIHRQSEYHEAILIRLVKQARLTEMQNLIRIAEECGRDIINWNGYEMSVKRALTEAMLEDLYYKRAIQNETTLKNSLINEYGMTEEQIKDIVITDKYVKDLPDIKPKVEESV